MRPAEEAWSIVSIIMSGCGETISISSGLTFSGIKQ